MSGEAVGQRDQSFVGQGGMMMVKDQLTQYGPIVRPVLTKLLNEHGAERLMTVSRFAAVSLRPCGQGLQRALGAFPYIMEQGRQPDDSLFRHRFVSHSGEVK
jgi:hypothetical protein